MLNPNHLATPALYDALDVGIVVLDSEGNVRAWNAWLVSASGITAEDVVGQKLSEAVPGIGRAFFATVAQAFEFGASRMLTHSLHPALLPLRTRAGRPLIHDVSIKPFGDAPHRHCVIQITDVTIAVERERVLRDRYSARYASVVDNAPDPILTLDADGIVHFANPAVRGDFGYEPAELAQRRADILFQNDAEWQRVWEAAGQQGQRAIDAVGRRKDGSLTHIEISASRWLDHSRTFVSVILRDVNERFEAQEALKRWSEMLEDRVASALAERKVLADIVEGSPAAVTVLDLDHRILAINRANIDAFERAYGKRPAVGDDFFALFQSLPEHLPQQQAIWTRALAGETFEVIDDFGASSSDARCYEVRFSPLLNAAGRQIGASSTSYDITDRVRDQQRLRETEEALRQSQKMEAIGQLTGGIAHDFNNLLAGIIGAMEMLRRRIKAGRYEESQRFMDAAVASANRAASLTHRLLAFARRQPLDPRPLEVNQLINGMEDLLRRSMGEQIQLKTDLRDGAWYVNTDANQLENAILNLAINARDAMPEGGTLSIITQNVTLERPLRNASGDVAAGEYLLIAVKDTGIGMPAALIEKVFDPFFTTKPIGQGTGLGLSMVYGFAQQSGGQARIESKEGEGTSVILYLPRYKGAIETEAVIGSDLPLPSGEGETVLLVEDDAAVRLLIGEVLRDLGYRCVEAMDAFAALPMITSNARIDLLISDVGLPRMNGRQLAEIARQHRPDLKILFVTGYAEHATGVEKFLEPGMELVTKPFTLDALALKIRDMVRTRSAQE